ncbi:unnamed protein product [Adineta steineri]|uniref:Uncharacterized protein n=1 Tax=Adineta steineri TaxID=433720 RepID=A0A814TC86_9BILA|nr:unnamed protein product [Adineta steineri]CAF1355975.1 unnamed protein product [Adineta steineri]
MSIDSFDENLLTKALQLIQVTFFYVISSEDISKETLPTNIRGVFNNEEHLLSKIAKDIEQYSPNICKFNILSSGRPMKTDRSTKDLSRESAKFIWFQYLIEILLSVPDHETAKKDMIDFCCSRYADNQTVLKTIQEFKNNYRSEEAIKWYARGSFLYHLVNKVLREENIDDMYSMRLIFSDLNTQLTELHADYLELLLEWEFSSEIELYRGQLMSPRELDRLKRNCDGFISMNTYLSTSRSRNIALFFCGLGLQRQQEEQLESVLFTISIETTVCNTPFADIKRFSSIPNEEEILITVGAIFQIQSVEKEDNVWIIKLALYNQDNEDMKQLKDSFYGIDEKEPHDLHTFAQCLLSMGDHERAKSLYCRLISSTSPADNRMPELWRNLALCLLRQGHKNLGEILTYFYTGLNLIPNESYAARVDILLDIADCLLLNEKLDQVNEVCKEIYRLLILNQQETGHLYQIARLFTLVAAFHHTTGEYSVALEFLQAVYLLYFPTLKEERLSVDYILKNLAETIMVDDTVDTLDSIQRSLQLHINSFPLEHPKIADCYDILGWFYGHHGDILRAQMSFETAIELRISAASYNPIHLAMSYIALGKTFHQEKAMNCYDKAFCLLKENLPVDHSQFIDLYVGMANEYEYMGKMEQTRHYLNEALKIEHSLKRLTSNIALAEIYKCFGTSYLKEEEYDVAADYFNKSIEILIQCSSDRSTKRDLAHHLFYLGCAYQGRKEFELALSCYKRSLDIDCRQSIVNRSQVGATCNNIALILEIQQKYDGAYEYFLQSVQVLREYFSDQCEGLFERYTGLARVCKYLKRDAEFLEYNEKALIIVRNAFPEGSSYAGDIHNSIARFWESKGEYMYAFKSYKSALESNRQCFGDYDITVSNTYNNLARISAELCESNKALEYYHKALASCDASKEIKRHLFGNIGIEYYILERYGHAEIYLKRTLLMFKNASIDKKSDYKSLLDYLARVKAKQGKIEEAEKLCQTVLCAHSEDTILNALSYITFGIIRSESGGFGDSLSYFHKAANILKTLDADHRGLIQLYAFRIGSTYYNCKHYGKALVYYEMALNLAIRLAPGNPKQFQRIQYGIERIIDHIMNDSNHCCPKRLQFLSSCILF